MPLLCSQTVTLKPEKCVEACSMKTVLYHNVKLDFHRPLTTVSKQNK